MGDILKRESCTSPDCPVDPEAKKKLALAIMANMERSYLWGLLPEQSHAIMRKHFMHMPTSKLNRVLNGAISPLRNDEWSEAAKALSVLAQIERERQTSHG